MHFVVIVVHDKDQDIHELLAPFQENNMGDIDEKYLKFDDETEEIQGQYDALDEAGKAKYPTLDDYATDYWGADEHEGRYGRFYNPDSEWDWYQIGGRWAGFFLMKPGKEGDGIEGEASLLSEDFVYPKGYADSACISDIDFEGMRDNAEKLARERHKKIMELVKDCPPFKPWEHFKVITEKSDEGAIVNARNLYNNQEAIIKFSKSDLSGMFDFLENYTNITEDMYASKMRNRVASCVAWLENGQWTSSSAGFMQDDKEWDETVSGNYERLLKESPEKWLTIVDCHT